MKKLLKTFAIVLALLLVISAVPVKVQAAAAKAPKLTKTKLTLTEGKRKTISVKAGEHEIIEVIWKTSDKSIAKVNKKDDLSARIKSISAGKATITATVKTEKKNYSLKVTVTVKEKAKPIVIITDTDGNDYGNKIETGLGKENAIIFTTQIKNSDKSLVGWDSAFDDAGILYEIDATPEYFNVIVWSDKPASCTQRFWLNGSDSFNDPVVLAETFVDFVFK